MADVLFLKGDSSRIDVDVTPFHEGWFYLTPDDGGFYVDTVVDGVEQRVRINSGGSGVDSTAVVSTLAADKWSNGEQTITVKELRANQNGIIGITQDISAAQMEAVKSAEMYVCGQGTGTLTIAADGVQPPCDIPVVIVLFG